jgi:hypothetical protein
MSTEEVKRSLSALRKKRGLELKIEELLGHT